MSAIITFVILLSIILAYILFMRPWLEAKGWVRELPPDLETWRGRIAAFVRESATILWGWIVTLAGLAALIPQYIAEFFNDPEIKAQITTLLGGNAKYVAGLFIFVGLMTIIARMRTASKVN